MVLFCHLVAVPVPARPVCPHRTFILSLSKPNQTLLCPTLSRRSRTVTLICLSQTCSADPLRRWSRATWWRSRRPNTKPALKSTTSARRTSCWTDHRRSPVCQTAAGASRRHFAEVRNRLRGPSYSATMWRSHDVLFYFLRSAFMTRASWQPAASSLRCGAAWSSAG